MLETKAVFHRKDTEIEAKDCVVDNIIRLSGSKFDRFSQNLLRDWDFIRNNPIDTVVDEQGRYHCLLVLGEGHSDGILVNAEGSDYARYSAFLPHAQTLVAVERDRSYGVPAEKEFMAWAGRLAETDGHWREDKRYRRYKDGTFFYLGGESGQCMHIANNGQLTLGRYEFARPGIEDAVMVHQAWKQYGNYEQAFLSASQLAGPRFAHDLFHEKPSVIAQLREAKKAPPVPRKEGMAREVDGQER